MFSEWSDSAQKVVRVCWRCRVRHRTQGPVVELKLVTKKFSSYESTLDDG